MRYLDSNVFIYAALYDGAKATEATRILEAMVAGEEPAATASLAVDEVVWILSGHTDRAVAIEQGRRMLGFSNLRVLDVSAETVARALDHLETYDHLTPRDAVHLAGMIHHGIYTIVSDDGDFDDVEEVERQSLDVE